MGRGIDKIVIFYFTHKREAHFNCHIVVMDSGVLAKENEKAMSSILINAPKVENLCNLGLTFPIGADE